MHTQANYPHNDITERLSLSSSPSGSLTVHLTSVPNSQTSLLAPELSHKWTLQCVIFLSEVGQQHTWSFSPTVSTNGLLVYPVISTVQAHCTEDDHMWRALCVWGGVISSWVGVKAGRYPEVES